MGAFVEDIENDLLAVDHSNVAEFFPRALLCGGEAVVENDDVALMGAGEIDDFLSFARATNVLLVHVATAVKDTVHDADAESFHEFVEFFEQRCGFVLLAWVKVNADEHGALDHFRAFSYIKHQVASMVAEKVQSAMEKSICWMERIGAAVQPNDRS
jgi:hypothetical protein